MIPYGNDTTTHNCHAGHDVLDVDLVGMVAVEGIVRKYCIAHSTLLDDELKALGAQTNVLQM